jgi:hypothetical protein
MPWLITYERTEFGHDRGRTAMAASSLPPVDWLIRMVGSAPPGTRIAILNTEPVTVGEMPALLDALRDMNTRTPEEKT